MSGERHGTKTPAGEDGATGQNDKPPGKEPRMPGAGPHAKPELTNEDATPGAGSLPHDGETGDDAGAG